MDELTLIVEGIQNKVQKLAVRNNQLKDRLLKLEQENQGLQKNLEIQQTRIRQLEEEFSLVLTARAMGTGDSSQAKQKVNELLREIEKCYALLNR